MKYKLMIKTHNLTGLKYLCVTTRENYVSYTGSGIEWKKHLKEHGRKFKTELIYESDDIISFSDTCIRISREYNIVESNEWANKVIESGSGEYPVDQFGNRIKRNKNNLTDDELDNIAKSSKWFMCSVCHCRMTEGAFKGHKCIDYIKVPFDYNEWQKQFHS